MKRKVHDYTKPADAECHLYRAQRAIALDEIHLAEEEIIKARELLQEYLSLDNEIWEDDLC